MQKLDKEPIIAPAAHVKPSFGVFGAYRFMLALLVVLTHAGPRQYHYAGTYAVFAFYVLSGYVVSYILKYFYLPQPGGIKKFFLNRALRIYPPYIAACLLCASILFLCHTNPSDATESAYLSGKSLGNETGWWFLSLSLLPYIIPLFNLHFTTNLIEIAYSLGIEIDFWILIPIALIHPSFRKGMLVFCIGYTIFTAWMTLHLGLQTNLYPLQLLRYLTVFPSALPFYIGMALLLKKSRTGLKLPHVAGITAMMVLAICIAYAKMLKDPYFMGAYVALVCNALIIAYLSQFSLKDLNAILSRVDSFFGNLSYPLFLSHLPMMVLLHAALPALALNTATFFWLTACVSLPVAALLHYGIEYPVDRLRKRIKSSKTKIAI